MKCKRVLLHFVYLYSGSFQEIFKALLVFSGFNSQGNCVCILFSLPLMIVSELCLLVSVCVCQLIHVSPWPRPLWAWISSSEVGCTRSAVPSFFGTRDQIHGKQFFHRQGAMGVRWSSGSNGSDGERWWIQMKLHWLTLLLASCCEAWFLVPWGTRGPLTFLLSLIEICRS